MALLSRINAQILLPTHNSRHFRRRYLLLWSSRPQSNFFDAFSNEILKPQTTFRHENWTKGIFHWPRKVFFRMKHKLHGKAWRNENVVFLFPIRSLPLRHLTLLRLSYYLIRKTLHFILVFTRQLFAPAKHRSQEIGHSSLSSVQTKRREIHIEANQMNSQITETNS